MANTNTDSLDAFINRLSTSDTKKKILVAQDMLEYFCNDENNINSEDFGPIVDGIVPWIQSSNYKISSAGLEVVTLIISRVGSLFRIHLNSVIPNMIDRLGDVKEIVRERAKQMVDQLLKSEVIAPQALLDKMAAAFSHKNNRVKCEALGIVINMLDTFGSDGLTISRTLPHIVPLLLDSTAHVREAACSTLVEIYRHVGERLRFDLERKHSLPQSKLTLLFTKFDALQMSGDLLPTATRGVGTVDGACDYDDTDKVSVKSSNSAKNRSSSVPASVRRSFTFITPKLPPDGRASTVGVGLKRHPSIRSNGNPPVHNAGGIDEESFIYAFEDVKRVTLFSGRGLTEELIKIRDTLTKISNVWNVRLDALQHMRSLLLAGAAKYEELIPMLKQLEIPFQLSIKDLRSQVVREACITIGYMSQQLYRKVDRFIEALLQDLINLIPNSAKVVSTSGIVCIRFIIQNTYSPRFLPVLTKNVGGSKARDIRRHCCEFLDQLLHTWPTSSLEKHVDLLQEALRKGISDADPDARLFARKAFWGFADHFKEHSEVLLNSLEASYRRLLQTGGVSAGNLSNSSSSNSLHNMVGRYNPSSVRSRQSSNENIEQIRKVSRYGANNSGIPLYTSPPSKSEISNFNGGVIPVRQSPNMRSNSAIDPAAVRRATVRAQYSQRRRLGAMNMPIGIPPRPRKSIDKCVPTPPPSNGRSRSRIGGVLSQPGSRSNSPTSLKHYSTYIQPALGIGEDLNSPVIESRRRRSSGIPRSTGPSRDPSPLRRTPQTPGPNKFGFMRSTPISKKTAILGEQTLNQSYETEAAMADALNYDISVFKEGHNGGSRKDSTDYGIAYRKSSRKQSYSEGLPDEHSDESETSSLCSDVSFDVTGGIGLGRNRGTTEDIATIISNCSSTHWTDRKDGLIGLLQYVRGGRLLSGSELRRVTEIFTRMFVDAHTKVFSLFLDTLTEVVVSHRDDLGDWLFILLTRLLMKLGTDLLGSIAHKINKTLQTIGTTFSHEDQFVTIIRFLADPIQTPNTKSKIATLTHLQNILLPEADFEGWTEKEVMQSALDKIVTWSSVEQKALDLRKAASMTLVALYSNNSSFIFGILKLLPKSKQLTASDILRLSPALSSVSSTTLRSLQSPYTTSIKSSPVNSLKAVSSTNSSMLDTIDITLVGNQSSVSDENLAPEDIRRSLHSTANAIQNYSYETKNDELESQMASMSIQKCLSNSPEANIRNNVAGDGDKTVRNIIEGLSCSTDSSVRRTSMTKIVRLCRDGNTKILFENFKTILRLLLDSLSDSNVSTRALVFGVLTEMLQCQELSPCFHDFMELLILKVLDGHRDKEKDVERSSERCSLVLANSLPSEFVIRVLNPIIKTGEFPINQAAIKMMIKVVEREENVEIVTLYLNDCMSGLLKAYDSVQSSVRKAAVFCMVALHQRLGEEKLSSHLASLNGSKQKLLTLYIKRAQTQNSTPARFSSPT